MWKLQELFALRTITHFEESTLVLSLIDITLVYIIKWLLEWR